MTDSIFMRIWSRMRTEMLDRTNTLNRRKLAYSIGRVHINRKGILHRICTLNRRDILNRTNRRG